jgi:UTP--glucose-1-phosphate uridylyltransferase
VFAYDFEGKRHDIGEKLGFVKTTIEFALQNEKIRSDILEYLDEILHREL